MTLITQKVKSIEFIFGKLKGKNFHVNCFFVNLGEIQNYFPCLELLNWAELIIG